jgi:Flp pilus assembly pilin Flp
MQPLIDRFKRDGFGATPAQYAVIAFLTAIVIAGACVHG